MESYLLSQDKKQRERIRVERREGKGENPRCLCTKHRQPCEREGMELLSKPLHYVNRLTTQITTLHRSTQSPIKTHVLSTPGLSSPRPPLPPPPWHSPAFTEAAEVRQNTVHVIFEHHRGKHTGAKQGDTAEQSKNKLLLLVSGRTRL